MGLSKLLAVGRSVRSVTKQQARYKMTQQNLLPTFGGTKAAEASAAEVVQPAAQATPKSASFAPAAHGTSSDQDQQGPPGTAKADAFLEATKKLRPFGGGAWFKNLFTRTASRKQVKVPVQTELSLDSVRPVRNELNEPEIELGRTPRCTVQEAGTPETPKVAQASPAADTGGLWQRLKSRLFGARDEN